MANVTALRGRCPAPFFSSASFPPDEGFIAGRFCVSISPTLECCLPCPATDFLYPASFNSWYTAAEWISVVGFSLGALLLLTWSCLPVETTRRHYLSYGLIIGTSLLSLGFVVPLGQKPDQCYNEITPNDMYSSLTCAFSGAFIISGALTTVTWIFVRALSMHLQICWDIVPGQKFFYVAQGLGWGLVAVLFTITITITGVSFRFGNVCHVNSLHSMKDFWGPLLGIAGLSAVVQVGTFAYCIQVYLRNMWSDNKTETQSSAGLPSYTTSVTRANSARAIYRRVKKVVGLQWRGIVIVVIVLVDVIFFSIIFIYLDNTQTRLLDEVTDILPWATCIMQNPTDQGECFDLAQDLFVSMPTIVAILLMLSMVGLQTFLLLFRPAMFPGWVQFFRQKFSRDTKREFVSLDARRFSSDARTFELLKVGQTGVKSPETAITPASLDPKDFTGDMQGYGRSKTPDWYHKETQREYRSPESSFSSPRSPTQGNLTWDPASTYARSGLAMHPAISEDEEPINRRDKY